jgi:hypothetical protein
MTSEGRVGCAGRVVQVPAETWPPDTWVSRAGRLEHCCEVGQVRVGRGIALDLVQRRQAPAGPSVRRPDIIMWISELGACRQHRDPAYAMPSANVHRTAAFGALGQTWSVATAKGSGSGRYAKVPGQFFV